MGVFGHCGTMVNYHGCGFRLRSSPTGENATDATDVVTAEEMPAALDASAPEVLAEHENLTLSSTGGFCAAKYTGWFCSGFTRVKCCKRGLVFVHCGTLVNYHGCGFRL